MPSLQQRVYQNSDIDTPLTNADIGTFIQYAHIAVEGVSKLSFQCGSRDAINRVSTTVFGKLLIFNVLYVVAPVETWRAASLQHQCRNFDTPSTTGRYELFDYQCLTITLCVVEVVPAKTLSRYMPSL